MKNLSYLIESELEKAEVILAAKSITDSIQKMAETAAKMEAEDVMPLNDAIREHFGADAAAKFSENTSAAIRDLTQKLVDAKAAVANEISRMQGETIDEPSSDLDGLDDEMAADDAEVAAPEAAEDDDLGLDELDFGDDEEVAPEAPRFDDQEISKAAGRARKESAVPVKKPLVEGDAIVARQYVKLLREGNTPRDAAYAITDTYGIDVETLIAILEDSKSK